MTSSVASVVVVSGSVVVEVVLVVELVEDVAVESVELTPVVVITSGPVVDAEPPLPLHAASTREATPIAIDRFIVRTHSNHSARSQRCPLFAAESRPWVFHHPQRCTAMTEKRNYRPELWSYATIVVGR